MAIVNNVSRQVSLTIIFFINMMFLNEHDFLKIICQNFEHMKPNFGYRIIMIIFHFYIDLFYFIN